MMAHATAKRIGSTGVLVEQRVRIRKDVKDTGFLYITLALVFVSLLFLFVYLWSRVNVVQYGYELSMVNSQRAELMEKNRRLRMEQTRLKSPREDRKGRGLPSSVSSTPPGRQIIRIKK